LRRALTIQSALRAILSGSEARLDPAQWVDGEVRVAGVAQSLFNSRGELLGARIHTDDPADFSLLLPAHGDPWSAPPGDLRRLLPFSRAGFSLHRVRIRGTVLLSRPGEMLYLQQGDIAIQVRTSARDPLRPGDDVEVSGFVDQRVHVAGLENAAVRVLGAGPVIAPRAIAVGELFRMKGGAITAGADDFDGRPELADYRPSTLSLTAGAKTRFSISGKDGRGYGVRPASHKQIKRAPPSVAHLFIANDLGPQSTSG